MTHAMLGRPLVHAVPGETADTTLSLRNTTDVVDTYRLSVVGAAAGWTTVEPAEVSLYPGAEAEILVTFGPPRSSEVPAGEHGYAVRVMPQERPDSAVAVEGRVDVAPFTRTTADVVPRTSHAVRTGRHEIAVDNRGNVPVEVEVSGSDPDDRLDCDARPDTHVIPPGQAVFTRLHVRARKRLWRGRPVTHPFTAVVTAPDPVGGEPDRIPLDGALVQRPLIPRNAPRWLAALLALAVALVAVWFLLLKPAVETAATEAVESPMQELAEEMEAVGDKADDAKTAAEEAEAAVEGTEGEEEPAAPETVETPVTVRLETTVPDNGTGTATHTVPAETVLAVTDLFLENPQGDAGKLEVLIGGKVWRTFALANFRDLDFHHVTPIEVPAGQPVQLRVTCETPGDRLAGVPADRCFTAIALSGVNRTRTDEE
ncbi:hypothetical protein LX16_4832 [Stackebrandtia albiflava]|uniref:Hydrolytic protein n=1 Tax=Stackebrandtia albiflava TaxID=406432 RepID=A0A562UPX5_9ACTN|nr:hypothetical protein [Stackebrandtia albiflava]TWJ07673.1 hypothetical protein LX16_4832 [Stackebrandtia albiflava]